MFSAENMVHTVKPFNPEVQKKCIGDDDSRSHAVRQIFLRMSWANLKARWHSVKSRMRTFCPMHCSHRLLLTSSSIVEAQEKKVDETVADTKNGAYPV